MEGKLHEELHHDLLVVVIDTIAEIHHTIFIPVCAIPLHYISVNVILCSFICTCNWAGLSSPCASWLAMRQRTHCTTSVFS